MNSFRYSAHSGSVGDGPMLSRAINAVRSSSGDWLPAWARNDPDRYLRCQLTLQWSVSSGAELMP